MYAVQLLAFSLVAGSPVLLDTSEVDHVWAGHPVGFALLTHGNRQFVAYYDAERRMTVAARELDQAHWEKAALPEQLGWDSHNYVTLAVDDEGYLHLSGNMHVSPLVYFRTTRPLDVQSFERASMVGQREDRCTYPTFLRGANDAFLFTYRDGQSGSGDQIYNVYDASTKTWRRLLDTPLTSGQGKMNAYFHGPVKGPDGRFHLCWVWRDTPGCEFNHDLCYALSADLVHWETSSGKPLTLPITLETAEVVDAVPVKSGMINGNTKLGFDSKQHPIISYHKFDSAGNTQIYNARLEGGTWRVFQTSDWAYRWEFSGGGAIPFEIRVSGVRLNPTGGLEQSYSHVKYGSGAWLLDETTLKPVGQATEPAEFPDEMSKVVRDFPGMEIRRANDAGKSGEPGVRYVLQWESLGANRDRPRIGPLPSPSILKVVKIRDAAP